MPPDQAAEVMGCSKATLAVTLHRALGALRKEVGS
jgi:DNA-directed RNA polymerase specialized sigma24 family protein